MEFRILGDLEVRSEEGAIELRGAKRRAVLGILLVRSNQVVSADSLIEDLWDGRPPSSAVTTLQTYVYQLRKALRLEALQTRPAGYVLEIERDQLDAFRFEDVLQRLEHTDGPSRAHVAATLRGALGWWRGPALSDFAGMAWARAETARLESLRLGAIEDLMDARLALAEHTAIVGELEALVAAHPVRERLWALLMLALYRSDRQADALRAATRVRNHLRDELGIQPGAAVTELEHAILVHDPALRLTSGARISDAEEPAATSPARVASAQAHRRRRRGPLVAVAVAAALATIVGGLVAVGARRASSTGAFPAPSGYQPRYADGACPAMIKTIDTTARCGTLQVPENRRRPRVREIRLGVYRFPSRADHPTHDPVVQVEGDFRLTQVPSDSSLRTRSDSIWLAGRGFFGSNPRLTCPQVTQAVTASLARPARAPENVVGFLEAVGSCRDGWMARGVDLASYSAAERAADVRDLAVALHFSRVNLIAGGPSTLDAREIAGRYPGLVRSILLLNVAPPEANRWNGAITNAAGALDRYFGECAAQPKCAATYGDLRAHLDAMYARGQSTPVTYTATNPWSGAASPVRVLLDGDRSMQIALNALDEPDALPLVAAAIADPQGGQSAVDFGVKSLVFPDDTSWGALLSGICIDEMGTLAREGLRVEASAEPKLAVLVDDPRLDACGVWKTSPQSAHAPSPAGTPTLVLEGELDPFTSSGWAEQTAHSFGRATIVALPHLGRVAASGDACITRVRLEFLDNPTAAVDATSCRHEIAPIQFTGAR